MTNRHGHSETSQDNIILFLSGPAAYGESESTSVSVVETHGAMVFLCGDSACKIKKAVRFSYMDFSTLALREAACRSELALNQTHAPQIYQTVVPVTRQPDGTLALEGDGEPVEWVLRMHRFPDDALLCDQLHAGRFTPDHVDALCEVISNYHAAAPVSRDSGFAGRFPAVVSSLNKSFDNANASLPRGLPERFRQGVQTHLEACAGVLRQREAAGLVRRCHGDLHLSNVVVLEGEPVLFDALEFSEELATIDILYDLAFMVMALVHDGFRAEANRLLGCWLDHTSDLDADLQLDGLAALPLFIAIRAGVRAMVALDRAAQCAEDDREAANQQAAGYLELAVTSLQPQRAHLLAIGGYSGTGKTTVARALAPLLDPAPGALHLRTDVERKRMAGVCLDQRLPPESYTKAASDAVYAAVMAKAERALAAGWPVVIDAAFLDPAEREAVEILAREAEASFTGLWLEADEATLVARVGARQGDASDATADVVRGQLVRGAGDIGWARIDAGGSIVSTVDACRAALGAGK